MQPMLSVLAVCGVYAFSVASPGPSTLLVLRRSASGSHRLTGMASGFGTTLGSAIYAAGSLFGLTMLLLQIKGLAVAVRIAGGCYLIWLGGHALANSHRQQQAGSTSDSDGLRGSATSAFREALFVNMANPKTAAFFISLLAPAISPHTPTWARTSMLAGIVSIDLIYFQVLAAIFSRPRVQRFYARARTSIERVAGCVLTAFGIGLVVEGALEA